MLSIVSSLYLYCDVCTIYISYCDISSISIVWCVHYLYQLLIVDIAHITIVIVEISQ